MQFQSTLPVGGATDSLTLDAFLEKISIHAPRGGSDEFTHHLKALVPISIHAPRGGSD